MSSSSRAQRVIRSASPRSSALAPRVEDPAGDDSLVAFGSVPVVSIRLNVAANLAQPLNGGGYAARMLDSSTAYDAPRVDSALQRENYKCVDGASRLFKYTDVADADACAAACSATAPSAPMSASVGA